jgi:hypothetical protein
MKADPIIQEVEAVKDRLAEQAGGDLRRFLDQMEEWQAAHPHAGPVVNSPEELQARLRHREATEPPPPPAEPYRVYDPIIAEVHRIRERLCLERENAPLILKDEPPRKKE